MVGEVMKYFNIGKVVVWSKEDLNKDETIEIFNKYIKKEIRKNLKVLGYIKATKFEYRLDDEYDEYNFLIFTKMIDLPHKSNLIYRVYFAENGIINFSRNDLSGNTTVKEWSIKTKNYI